MTTHAERELELSAKDEHELRSILDLASGENRDLSPEEDERIEKLFSSSQAHQARADKLVEMATKGAALADAVRAHLGDVTIPDGGSDAPTGFDSSLIGNIRSVQDAYRRNGSFDDELWTTGTIDLASIINADNGRPLIIPNITVDPTSYTNGEATAITESTPTFGTATPRWSATRRSRTSRWRRTRTRCTT
jgi:hypothetical protein